MKVTVEWGELSKFFFLPAIVYLIFEVGRATYYPQGSLIGDVAFSFQNPFAVSMMENLRFIALLILFILFFIRFKR